MKVTANIIKFKNKDSKSMVYGELDIDVGIAKDKINIDCISLQTTKTKSTNIERDSFYKKMKDISLSNKKEVIEVIWEMDNNLNEFKDLYEATISLKPSCDM